MSRKISHGTTPPPPLPLSPFQSTPALPTHAHSSHPCREARLETLETGSHLRVVGTAFVVLGSVERTVAASHDDGGDIAAPPPAAAAPGTVFSAPCILPPVPARYLCTSKVRALHLPSRFDAHAEAERLQHAASGMMGSAGPANLGQASGRPPVVQVRL